ncbi:putative reverse transcriptase zinc-binding domain-containing protein [Lupinus albus]|uniref:Putative reverse transcriptase zinc-binding domain-containing protein n=1 Tax=Lupinus albus TaxID=3870 RepID=A0A6A4NI31_LUPAL|nr:putative reverse transcriptase zinc-binding domain-containing protein [Lupinus albus]
MDALVKQGVHFLNESASLCVFCKSQQEYVNHLFSSCKFSYALWQLIYNWLNISLPLPLVPIHHFSSFLGLMKNRKCWKLWSVI